MFNLGVISGVQARTLSLDDSTTVPQRSISTSEDQGQVVSDEGPDVNVRSPVRCVSPEFVNAIAMNPGGRPKEVESKHSGEWWNVKK